MVTLADGGQRYPSVLLYGDVNLNLIDGSSVWLIATADLLQRAGAAVTVLLKAPVHIDRLVADLDRLRNVTVMRAAEGALVDGIADSGMTPTQAAWAIRRLDVKSPFDMLWVRGRDVTLALARRGHYDDRLWPYLTDVPQQARRVRRPVVRELAEIVAASRRVVLQTEELRSFLDALVPGLGQKAVIVPPVVPDVPGVPRRGTAHPELGELRLVYSGKFSPQWKTLEMTELPGELQRLGVAATLTMIGDKIQHRGTTPNWSMRMKAAMASAVGVNAVGGMSREAAMTEAAQGDVGLSWRDPAQDLSLELSTKVLEYGALGLPVLLNRTAMHERLLGPDYPLFVDHADPVDALVRLVRDPSMWSTARARCLQAAKGHGATEVAGVVRHHIQQAFPREQRGQQGSRIVVAGHDLKFAHALVDRLGHHRGIDLRVDRWTSLHRPSSGSQEAAEWAQTVFCEWLGPNVVWYGQRLRADQRLVARFHRFEIGGPWLPDVDPSRLERAYAVTPSWARLLVETTGWSPDKVAVIPNYIDVDAFSHPKDEGAFYRLGVVGIVPALKRLDLALDVLERVATADGRFTLHVKSRMPWEFAWIWKEPEERSHYEAVFARIRGSRLLRDRVVFDAPGSDVASWLQQIGWVLSTSDAESFHLAPVEGMASGSVPLVIDRIAAREVFPDECVKSTADELAGLVLGASPAMRDERGAWCREWVEPYSLRAVSDAWAKVLVEAPA